MTKDNDQPVMAPVGPSIAVPAKFQLKDDTATAWKTFKQRFTLYLLAGGYNKRPENEKVALLLTVGGDEMIEIYNAFEWASAADKEKYNPEIAKFEEHFIPKQHFSELTARYKSNGMDGWMNGVLGHFYALSRLNWAGDTTWANEMNLG